MSTRMSATWSLSMRGEVWGTRHGFATGRTVNVVQSGKFVSIQSRDGSAKLAFSRDRYDFAAPVCELDAPIKESLANRVLTFEEHFQGDVTFFTARFILQSRNTSANSSIT